MKDNETNILRRVWKSAARAGLTLFRNNVGLVVMKDRAVRYGLHEGSADLIGWESVTITPEHVGQTIARFVAIEVKTPRGRLSEAQRKWLWQAAKAGCRVFVVDQELT